MLKFVVNLDSSKERFSSINSRLGRLNLNFERISAVNGRELSTDYINKITYPLTHKSKVLFPRELTSGEIGCFLSHKRCWTKLLESDEEWAAIIEDDVRVAKSAERYINNDSWIPDEVKICKLSLLKDNIEYEIEEGKELGVDQSTRLYVPLWPEPLGTQGYLISREVAERALSLSNKIIAPVDNFLFSKWFQIARNYDIWALNPLLVKEDDAMESVIGARKKNVKKASFFVRHGLKRNRLDSIVNAQRHSNTKVVYKFE